MATKTKKTTARRPTPRKASRPARKATRPTGAQAAAKVLRERWDAALGALSEAEAAVQKQVRLLMKKNRLNPKEASAVLRDLGVRFDRERKKLLKQLDKRVKTLQSRIGKERKVVGRMVDDAVRGTLATFNIPSRQEVAELTSKVDALSRKIDSFAR